MRPVHARILALGPLALAACVTPAATQDGQTLDVRHVMQAEINPAIVAIWDVGNTASNDEGMLDPARMTAENWTALATAAVELAATGDRMAAATEIRAASPGNMATEDYEVTMAQVQSYIDADPQGFRDLSARFAVLARQLESAALARDATAAGELVARMDTECTICHARYWYPEAE